MLTHLAHIGLYTYVGAESNPVKSFRNVIDKNYRVLVEPSTSYEEVLKSSTPGTSMHTYYYADMVGNPDAFMSPGAKPQDIFVKDKTLIYSSNIEYIEEKSLVALSIEETVAGQIAWGFQKDSGKKK